MAEGRHDEATATCLLTMLDFYPWDPLRGLRGYTAKN